MDEFTNNRLTDMQLNEKTDGSLLGKWQRFDGLLWFFVLGKWQGYFVDKRALRGHAAGSKWLIDVNITFQSGNKFTGKGEDDVGPFTFINGNISG